MRYFFTFCLIASISSLVGQNLVPNPSFEDTACVYIGDPFDDPHFFGAEGWFNPNAATPDYFGTEELLGNCGLNSIYDPDLLNVGEWQYPRTGNKMVGLGAGDGISCSREYLQIKLIEPLVQDSLYCIELFVSLGNIQGKATDGFGMFFSEDSLINIENGCWFEIDSYISNPEGNFLIDTLNWTRIDGVYSALGGESFITIGNPLPNEECSFVDVESVNLWDVAYYFVDDISVKKCTENSTSSLPNQVNITLYPNPVEDILYYKLENPCQIMIINSDGTILFDQMLPDFHGELDLRKFSSGLYILVFEFSDHIETRHFIKT